MFDKSFFITGTDTGIGKTYTSAAIAKKLIEQGKKVAYYKPIQTGCEKKDVQGNWLAPDVEFIKTQCPGIITICTYALELPATPELAAEKEKLEIDFEKIKADFHELQQKAEVVIVEGAGGLFVPICVGKTVADLIKFLNLPTLLVSANRLGTINHTCMSIYYAQSLGINLLGFCFSRIKPTDETTEEVARTNARFIEEYGETRYLKI